MKPRLVLAMDPVRTEHVLTPALVERLTLTCDVPDRTPLSVLDDDRAIRLLRDAEILLTGWGCPEIDRKVLARAPQLRLIAHAAGTVKYFIANEVFEAGVAVTHAADANALPVAEFTVAAVLLANKRVFQFRRAYAADKDRRRVPGLTAQPIGNFGHTVGVIGASKIGRKVIELLRPFALRVLLHDPFVSASEAARLGVELANLPDLMRRSDVVSIHAPALPTTTHMIDAGMLALLRDGTTLINTARGSLVDQDALIEALKADRFDAIIDVTEPEIPEATSPLYTLPNVFLTPHIAGAVGSERTRLGLYAVEEIERFISGEPMRYAIDLATLEHMA